MDVATFRGFRDAHLEKTRQINDAKGFDYAGEVDALANFKEAAVELIDIKDPTFQVWYIYFHKHLSAIISYLQHEEVKSEPIDGRVHDAINYLILLLGLIEDKKATPGNPGDEECGGRPCVAEDDYQ